MLFVKEFNNQDKNYRQEQLNLLYNQARQKNITLRKEGFFANIKFHLNHADENWNRMDENRARSMAIALQTLLGILFTALGGLLLIPTINTLVVYLPIAFITLGAILTFTALIMAYIDQHEAIETSPKLENLITISNANCEKSKSSLLKIWQDIQNVELTPYCNF